MLTVKDISSCENFALAIADGRVQGSMWVHRALLMAVAAREEGRNEIARMTRTTGTPPGLVRLARQLVAITRAEEV